MKRKIIQIAGSTQLVSLPRKWALKHNIQKGDEIDVLEDGDKIIVQVDAKHEVKKKLLEVKKVDNLLNRMLSALYKAGYEEIELRFNESVPTEDISENLKKHTPGFEIMDQTNNLLLIKSISEEQISEFDTSLRRVFLITITMAKNILESLKDPKTNNPNTCLTLEETNNRFTNFCERLLNKKGYNNTKDSNMIYTIVWELEKVADELKYIAQYMEEQKMKDPFSKGTISDFEKTMEVINSFYEVFYRYDEELINKINSLRKEIIQSCNESYKTKKGPELKIIHHITNITQMIYNITGCYMVLKN